MCESYLYCLTHQLPLALARRGAGGVLPTFFLKWDAETQSKMNVEFRIISQVGAGSRTPSTQAYKARIKHTLQFVGIKKCARQFGGGAMDAVVALHRSLPPHASLVKLLAYYATPRNIYRVYEFCAGGSLRALISSDCGLPEGSLRLFASDLTRMLCHAHASGVALGALTPEAILLDEEGSLRLANLRGAVRLGGLYDARACALAYSAPELVLARKENERGVPHHLSGGYGEPHPQHAGLQGPHQAHAKVRGH